MTPAALVIGLVRPAALLALLLLTVFAAAVARLGLWLLGSEDPRGSDVQAVGAAAVVFTAAVTVAAILLVLGPASVPVLAVLAVATAAGVAVRLRPVPPAI
ncbi:hypothetical protein EV378_3645 [Pseudonocardia endophytica]|uniref:Uncharacterized protein n=1 Tax=Pseudonocardia endophytica TaxID=401976 RepID=A0A4R1HY99_PSEEN|nr:hypothetical protein EV378_3645 [Pseudonocardia endophytica]